LILRHHRHYSWRNLGRDVSVLLEWCH
jgi:hypothetical protein